MSKEPIAEDFDIVSTKEVALRALVLFGIWMLSSTETPKAGIVRWIKDNNLWDSLSPEELAFIEANPATEKQIIDFSWHTERLHVLSWALGVDAELAPADRQTNIEPFKKALSPINFDTAKRFLKTAKLRDETELFEAADLIERYHWEARNAEIHSSKPSEPVDIEVIQERHHSINWILWGVEEDWDEVTTDT